MGGASSFLAMLAIAGFLSCTWIATKVSKLAGVSSIVLEITTGVLLGPAGLSLISDEYASCEHKRHIQCDPPPDFSERIAGLMPLGGDLGRIANMIDGPCKYSDYHHDDSHHGDSHGASAADANATDHDGHAATDHSGHAATDHSGHHRRLSGGGSYDSYEECLVKTCEAEISHHCQLTPDVFTLIGHAGVALMIFESGMHFDFEKARVVGGPACAVAVLGTILPLISGTILLVIFGRPFFPDGISAGTALAPTSVGIALRLLGEAGVLQENFGQAIITAAFVDDILSLVLFNVLFSLGGEFDLFSVVLAPIIGIIFMLLAMAAAVKIMPTLIDRMILEQAPENRDSGARGFRRFKLTKDELLFVLQMALLCFYGTVTHFLGTHLWGCFIAGMSFACLSPPHHAHHVWVKQTKRMTTWMIRIFFSCTVAFSIPVDKLLSFDAWWKGMLMGFGPCIATKVLCAPFMGKARFVIGWAMVGRAEFAYLIAQMAAAGNMMDQKSFSIVIWALLCATVFAPFIFRFLLNRYVKENGMAGAEGQGEAFSHSKEESLEYGANEVHDQVKSKDIDDFDGIKTADIDLAGPMKDPEIVGKANEEFDSCVPSKEAKRKDEKAGSGLLCCLLFKKMVVE